MTRHDIESSFKGKLKDPYDVFLSVMLHQDGKHTQIECIASLSPDPDVLTIVLREVGDVPLRLCTFVMHRSEDVPSPKGYHSSY